MDPAFGYSLYAGAIHLAAGLSCGFTGLAAGYAIGIVGDSVRFPLFRSSEVQSSECLCFCQCVRAYVYEAKLFVSMVLILIFAEVLGLYGYVILRLQ